MIILIRSKAGTFAENKDVARDIRLNKIMPTLAKGQKVTLDFAGVTGATQSFVHALISEAIRQYGDDVFDKLYFKNCSDTVREIVNIVAEYMQES
jgi:hypothetical protein